MLLEAFFRGFLASAKRTRLFIEEIGSPRIRALLDPANILEVNDLEEMFNQLGPYIDCLHAKDRKLHVDRGVPAGQGDLDYPTFVKLTAQRTPKAPLILEYVGPKDYKPPLHTCRMRSRRQEFRAAANDFAASMPVGTPHGCFGLHLSRFRICLPRCHPMTTSARYNTHFLWTICLVAAMGGLLFGYDWVVIGGAKPFYEPYFEITDSPSWQGFAMSSALFGCIFGAMMSGAMSDRFGRKRLLILSGLLFTSSAIWTALAGDFVSFNPGTDRRRPGDWPGIEPFADVHRGNRTGRVARPVRLDQSVDHRHRHPRRPDRQLDDRRPRADGRSMSAGTSAENSSRQAVDGSRARGRAGPGRRSKRRFPTSRSLDSARDATKEQKKAKAEEDAAIMAVYVRPTWNGTVGWRWMFGAETVPAFLFFLLMFFVPESPRWLVKNGRDAEAGRILSRVGGEEYAAREMADIKGTIASQEVCPCEFRRSPGTQALEGRRIGRFPGRVSAMVRDQRDLQLRPGGFSGRRL